MTTVDSVTKRALELKPTQVLLWLLVAPFILIGVLIRFVWLLPALLIGAVQDGWHTGTRLIEQMRVQARERNS